MDQAAPQENQVGGIGLAAIAGGFAFGAIAAVLFPVAWRAGEPEHRLSELDQARLVAFGSDEELIAAGFRRGGDRPRGIDKLLRDSSALRAADGLASRIRLWQARHDAVPGMKMYRFRDPSDPGSRIA